MTPQEEKYVHFVQCTRDLNDAWLVLTELRDRRQTGLIPAAAFRYAIVAYARPYTQSKGTAVRQHVLKTDQVPPQHAALHDDLLKRRHQVHAHSDLTLRNARLCVRATSGTTIVTQVGSGIHPLEEYDRLDEIIDLVELTLDAMYEKATNLEQALPPN